MFVSSRNGLKRLDRFRKRSSEKILDIAPKIVVFFYDILE